MTLTRLAVFSAFAALAVGSASTQAIAEPGGCMKYGAAGAVGGHMVGKGHAVAGAAAGCAAGSMRRHEAHKKASEAMSKSADKPADQPK